MAVAGCTKLSKANVTNTGTISHLEKCEKKAEGREKGEVSLNNIIVYSTCERKSIDCNPFGGKWYEGSAEAQCVCIA